MARRTAPEWVPDGYMLHYDPHTYEPHVHEREPHPNTPEGASITCKRCGNVFIAKNTQQGFVWTVAGYRLKG